MGTKLGPSRRVVLSPRAEVVLGIICECTARKSSGGLDRYFFPTGRTWDSVYGEPIESTKIVGDEDQDIVYTFAEQGIVEMKSKLSSFACASTEAGQALYEQVLAKRQAAKRAG